MDLKNEDTEILIDGDKLSIQNGNLEDKEEDGDRQQFQTDPKFMSSFDRANETEVSWNNVTVYAKPPEKKFFSFRRNAISEEPKLILDNVSGRVAPGELLAIMGASGAGKTTLMNVLTRRNLQSFIVHGEVKVNGVNVENSSTRNLSYVQQDDLFIGILTVKEHLVFQAMLRMDQHLTYPEKMSKVETTIVELGLTKCVNTKIGILGQKKGISGGERKRLAFASEVLTNPAVLLCDEPTSGLDSYMSMNVVSVLKKLALGGRTIICTIHQPSSEVYEMFDNILLMAEGKVAFIGHREDAITFFEKLGLRVPKNYNPADFFIYKLAVIPGSQEECRQRINKICQEFMEKYHQNRTAITDSEDISFMPKENTDGMFSRYKASWFTQIRALSWRSFLTVGREPHLYKIRLFQTVVISIMLGLIYFQQDYDQHGVMNINGVLFLMMTNLSFTSMFAVINVFCAELPIFLREHGNSMYRTDVYFFCKTLAEMPFFILLPIIFTCILYWMTGLKAEASAFFICLLALILVGNTAASFGYMVSCASNSVSTALSIGSPLAVPLMLFGGYFMINNTIPIYFNWIKYLSWYFYGFEILIINQWKNVTIACNEKTACLPDGEAVIQQLHFKEDFFLWDFCCLLALFLLYRMLAFVFLLMKSFKRT